MIDASTTQVLGFQGLTTIKTHHKDLSWNRKIYISGKSLVIFSRVVGFELNQGQTPEQTGIKILGNAMIYSIWSLLALESHVEFGNQCSPVPTTGNGSQSKSSNTTWTKNLRLQKIRIYKYLNFTFWNTIMMAIIELVKFGTISDLDSSVYIDNIRSLYWIKWSFISPWKVQLRIIGRIIHTLYDYGSRDDGTRV